MKSKFRVIQEVDTDEDGIVSVRIVKVIDITPANGDDEEDEEDEE